MISTDELREHIVSNAVKFIRYVVGDMRRRNSCRIDSDRLKFPPNCISLLFYTFYTSSIVGYKFKSHNIISVLNCKRFEVSKSFRLKI